MSSTGSRWLRTASKLTLVCVGLTLVLIIFLWPLVCCWKLQSFSPIFIWTIAPLLTAHFSLLIYCVPYLYIHRKILYPIRILLMPLVIQIAKSEAIKEESDTWYVSTENINNIPSTSPENAKELLHLLPKRVRRELKRKLKKFRERGIRTSSEHCDYLSLYKDMPVLIDHERRSVRGTDKSYVEEFIKRFLVIFLTTDGYIDRYYPPCGNDVTDDDAVMGKTKPVALSLFVKQGNVLHAFMYFCMEDEKDSGIWFFQHFLVMLRAASASSSNASDDENVSESRSPLLRENEIKYVNFHVHQDFAKKCVGATAAPWNHASLMDELYPFVSFQELPISLVEISPNINDILQ